MLRPALAVLLCDDDPGVREAALQHLHGVLPGALPRRLQVGVRGEGCRGEEAVWAVWAGTVRV